MKPLLLLLSVLLLSTHLAADTQILSIGDFSSKKTDGWKQKSFAGNSEYQLYEHEDKTVLRADSQKSASAYYRKVKIDLNKTPYLNWSWKKLNTLNSGDENKKEGDDFVARIYVVKDGGLFIWNTKALNYVWSYSHQQGEDWDNPFVGDKARMISVRDKEHSENKWFSEKRNIVDDFKQQFGIDITEIDGVAIMTDTDNSQGQASALYGDIYFTAE